jgi:hypothetical protein
VLEWSYSDVRAVLNGVTEMFKVVPRVLDGEKKTILTKQLLYRREKR